MVATWLNNDGLYRKFGPLKVVPNTGGEYKTFGDWREIELRIDLTSLTASPIIQNDEVFFPAGMRVEEVEVVTEVAATGASTLSVGLISTDRTTTLGATGFLAVAPLANMDAVGEKVTYRIGVAGVGTLVGTTTPTVGYITATGTATPFTAGAVRVRIRYTRVNTN